MKSAKGVQFGLMIILAATLAWELQPYAPLAVRVGQPEQKLRPLPKRNLKSDPNVEADVILARPLFSMQRQPSRAVGGDTSPARDAPPHLSGIVITASSKVALFGAGPKPIAAGVGETVGVYKVVAIDPMKVMLRGDKGLQTLFLSYDGLAVRDRTPMPPSLLDLLHAQQAPLLPVPHPPSIIQMLHQLPARR